MKLKPSFILPLHAFHEIKISNPIKGVRLMKKTEKEL